MDFLERIPQRAPFLFIDRLIDRTEKSIVTEKDITGEEDFFRGHFPGNPILPGVIQCEACFQTGALLMSYLGEQTKNDQVALVTRIQSTKFKNIVRPGETLKIHVELVEMMGPAAFMKGKITSQDKTVMTIEFACTITQKSTT
ncbi:MAG: beta-hydroxyacyl-ACP dehydratase [Bacteriovoracaceae bacterium]|nr:beta-hydroxyacyl-ACP dehydratase [Bacteriovoracaceae bacterium]